MLEVNEDEEYLPSSASNSLKASIVEKIPSLRKPVKIQVPPLLLPK